MQYNVAFIQFHTGYDMYINLFDSIMEKLARKYEEPKAEKGSGGPAFFWVRLLKITFGSL